MLVRSFRAAPALVAALACACAPGASPRSAAAPGGTRTVASGPAPAAAASAHPAVPAPDDDETSPDADEDADDGDEGTVDDAFEEELPPDATILPPHPLADVSDADLEKRLVQDAASLGSMSVGHPSAGLLVNARPMPEGDGWTLVDPSHAFGTAETVEYLATAIRAVDAEFPHTPKLAIGHISAQSGGYLRPHLSHQAGRDVDISYFYLGETRWYQRAGAGNLDAARTWAFVRALVTQTDAELLLIDRSIQKLLREQAERAGEDREWVDALFRGRGAVPPIVRHAPGHATHLHIRFYNPIAQETGRRCYPALVRHGMIKPAPAFLLHVAKKGETLQKLAKRYGTTVPAIRHANGLKSNRIQAKKAYRIPQTGHAPPSVVPGPVRIPPRRLPPARTLASGATSRQ